VHTMYAGSPVAAVLRSAGVPVCREIEAAAETLATLRARAAGPAGAVPELPASAERAVADGYWGARELVAAAGIELAQARRARTREEAQRAAAELGFPVVLKALGALHKSDAGGVVVGLRDAEALATALDDLRARLAPEEFSVERMAPLHDGVELLAGVLRDRRFGPVVLAGLGGVYAEVLDDVAVALAPIDAGGALELLRSLRGAALLSGARGRSPLAVAAAAEAIAALSRLAATCPQIAEIEVNPLLVTPQGVMALDARVLRVTASA
jgi:acetate---CoA ligase (ADP-forming)